MIRATSYLKLTRVLALFTTLICFATSADAQNYTVQNAPWFSRQIGKGVTWKHYQFDNLYGNRQSVSLIVADLNVAGVDVRIPYKATTRQRTSSMIPEQFPTAVGGVNGSFFDTSAGGGGSTTYLRINNVVITDNDNTGESLRGGVTVSSTDAVRVERRPSDGWANSSRRDILAQGPMLVRNLTRESASSSFCTARHPRTFVGITTGNVFIMATVDGRTDESAGMTCTEMQNLMLELGCDDATNMDGGGSTTMWVAGEPNNGVVNYPSDNGRYDHLGERSVGNAIAVIADPPDAVPLDARIDSVTYNQFMQDSSTQTVTVRYRNIGTSTWTRAAVTLNVTRPTTRISPFRHESWTSSTSPARMTEAQVLPGQLGTFTFVVKAPAITRPTTFAETFGLFHQVHSRFGPADNEPRLQFLVSPPVVPAVGSFLVESREGGANYLWYGESGIWADVNTDATAPGLTSGIGQRYGSSYRSVAGLKRATYRPDFAYGGLYDVDVTYGNPGSLGRSPITYKVNHAAGMTELHIDQRVEFNTWVRLGRFQFNPGTGGYVEVSNEDVDLSGNMYTAGTRFTHLPASSVMEWSLY